MIPIENFHPGEYVVITNTQYLQAGYPVKVVGIQPPSFIAVEMNGKVVPLQLTENMGLIKCLPQYVEAFKTAKPPQSQPQHTQINTFNVDDINNGYYFGEN